MALIIRPARTEDAERIRSLVREAYAPYVPGMGREPAPMTADYEGLIAADQVVVAEEGDDMVGAMVSYARGDHLHVENVAVVPSAQGRGVGTALMERAEAKAERLKLHAIELYTNEAMEENFAFYESLGYAITGRRIEDGYERVYFRKELLF